MLSGMLLGEAAWTGRSAASEVDVELIGFLIHGPSMRIEVPNEQGGPRTVIPVEMTARTDVALPAGKADDGQLVVLEGVLADQRVRVRRVRDVQIVEVAGRMSLAAGPLTLPVTADRIVAFVLDGVSSAPVSFLLTSRTSSARITLRDGQPVVLAVALGTRVVVGIEKRD